MLQFRNDILTVYQSALYQTTTTIVHTKDLILIADPNFLPHEIDEIKRYVDTIRGGRDLYLLFTHGDYDHVIGSGAFPNATTIASQSLAECSYKQETVDSIHQFDAKYYIERNYPVSFPKIDIVVQHNGQQLQVGETILTFYLAPGHTNDGLFTVLEREGIWIAGDYLSDFEVPFIYDSAVSYFNTLLLAEKILQKHPISYLIPGHGKMTSDRVEMERRIAFSTKYLNDLKHDVKTDNEAALHKLCNNMAYASDFTRQCHETNINMMKKML
ncbi:MBL fold metallo-hydrolase [Longirhabdus pacifica]|uniref:MBL fold metallo-hydrolase n=1 Tax=Longirhabdus pacifica TaxID=2305227 RepID=UPI001008E699|nr:MBL fold metallo-hydrolase [Longirhabdus pacifica]